MKLNFACFVAPLLTFAAVITISSNIRAGDFGPAGCWDIVSTDLEEIMEVADRVVILADGHLRFDAYLSDTTRDEILQRLSEVTK